MATLRKFVGSAFGFVAGYSAFVKPWPEVIDHRENNPDIILKLAASSIFNKITTDPTYVKYDAISRIPLKHQENHVALGLLYGFQKLEIKPIFFKKIDPPVTTTSITPIDSEIPGAPLMVKEKVLHDSDFNEMVSFYYLGSNLSNSSNKIHNGILSTLIDEGLCLCGFPKLPSKRGVTAKLSINFLRDDIDVDSVVVLKSRIVESKGRKCTIGGVLETVPLKKGEKSVKLADCECILVEPKWFKYLNWIDVF